MNSKFYRCPAENAVAVGSHWPCTAAGLTDMTGAYVEDDEPEAGTVAVGAAGGRPRAALSKPPTTVLASLTLIHRLANSG